MTNHRLVSIVVTLLVQVFAARFAWAQVNVPPADSVVVKLVTFFPGSDPFSIFGHTELRVTQGATDLYYNYGVYDFEAPHFVYRFVKGDVDYLCVAIYAKYATVGMEGRRMVEQELNLTQEQARQVRDYLVLNSQQGNNTYRYQYLGDNCSTRPRDIIEMALDSTMTYPQVTEFVTYRDMMSRYTRNYLWEQFGIDLVLGAGLDRKLDVRQQMFIPMRLMELLDSTVIERDGKRLPLVSESRIMVDVPADAMLLPPTPWWQSPLFVALLLLLVAVAFTLRDVRRGRVTRWFDSLVFSLYALVGCVLFFLMFWSVREATSPNYNSLWAHPLMFIAAIAVWIAPMRSLLRVFHWLNLVVVMMLLVVWAWLPQVANVAFFPLMLVTPLRSLGWLLCHRNTERS